MSGPTTFHGTGVSAGTAVGPWSSYHKPHVRLPMSWRPPTPQQPPSASPKYWKP